jgi:DNA repair exonuclease SbcCD nuclease subunit
MGDSRGNSDDCFLSGEFELVLRKAIKRDPLFIVHGGDTVYTGKREYLRHFVEVVERVAPHIPMFVCVGNHDELYINESNLANFRATIGKVHWVINIPQFHFRTIALNNIINPGSPTAPAVYGFTQTELDHLERVQIS